MCQPGPDAGQVMYRGRGWFVAPHPYPAPGILRHVIVAPEQHAPDLLDLPPWVLVSVWDVLRWYRGAHKLSHYGLIGRGGNPDATGAVLDHAHLEVIVGAVDQPGRDAVGATLSRPGAVAL